MFVDIIVVNAPAVEPVSVQELKDQLNLVDPVDADELAALNDLLTRKIQAARERCEGFTRRSLITQTIDVWYDSWDGPGIIEEVPRPPIQEILGIFSYDDGNVETEVDSSIYSFRGTTILFSDWIPTFRARRGIRVQLKTGYGDDPEDVPASLREGILEYAAHLYEFRLGEPSEGRFATTSGTHDLPIGVYGKWKRFRVEYV